LEISGDYALCYWPEKRWADGGVAAALRKQGVAVNGTVQHNQEFSIQNEDFPALPGCKGELTFLSVQFALTPPAFHLTSLFT
jgi:hypothetical protein